MNTITNNEQQREGPTLLFSLITSNSVKVAHFTYFFCVYPLLPVILIDFDQFLLPYSRSGLYWRLGEWKQWMGSGPFKFVCRIVSLAPFAVLNIVCVRFVSCRVRKRRVQTNAIIFASLFCFLNDFRSYASVSRTVFLCLICVFTLTLFEKKKYSLVG